MKYRRKPVVIEAVQHTGAMTQAMYDFLTQTERQAVRQNGDNFFTRIDVRNGHETECCLVIKTFEDGGAKIAYAGDFVVRDGNGKFGICPYGVFIATYEAVGD